MATAVQVGKETTHGTVASTFTSVPCMFNAKLNQSNKVLEEDRQGQDRHFAMVRGSRFEEFEVSDSAIYHDTFGYWLMSALGAPSKTVAAGETVVWDQTFKFTDDPASLSLKWQQPRRYTQAYQSLYAVVDEFGFKFAANGDLTYNLSGVAMGESEIAQITHSFSTDTPFQAWTGSVTLQGGAHARLLSGDVKIKRTRSPFFTFNNTQDPQKMSIGPRTVEFDLLIDFDSKAEYDDFKAANDDSFTISWVDTDQEMGVGPTNPQLDLKLGTIAYEEAEIDTDPDLPLLKITGKALYNAADASKIVVTLTSDVDYTL